MQIFGLKCHWNIDQWMNDSNLKILTQKLCFMTHVVDDTINVSVFVDMPMGPFNMAIEDK